MMIFTNLATRFNKLTKYSSALCFPLLLQLSKMPSVCKKTISLIYQDGETQLSGVASPLASLLLVVVLIIRK